MQNEKTYINIVNQTTEALLKDEVNITDQEKLQMVEWELMFEKYGVLDSDGITEFLSIPIETVDVLSLFPKNSNPIMMIASDKDIEVRYNIGSKTYGLVFNKSNKFIVKTIYLSLTELEYLIGYRNINNEQYAPIFVDLYP